MNLSKTPDKETLERLASGLEETSKLTKTLLTEVRDSEADFFVVRAELNTLKDSVKALLGVIQDGKSDIALVTKFALLEQKVENVYAWMGTHSQSHDKINTEMRSLHDELEDITQKLLVLEREVHEYSSRAKKEEHLRDSIIEEEARAEIQKKHETWRIKWEFVAGVILAIVTFVLGYYSGH